MAQGERSGRRVTGLSPQVVLIVAAFFIICYFGVSIVNNALHRYELDRQQVQMRQQIQSLETQKGRLDALRSYMQSDEFVERAGRAEGLIFPGDVPVFVSAPAPTPTAATGPTGPWWERYFGP